MSSPKSSLVSILCAFFLAAGASCAPEVVDQDPEVDPDEDADGDTITNGQESAGSDVDTDGDGTRDYEDLDSDDDGIDDADEAGDDDLTTSPVDSDGDGIRDFRDTDSDNNGRADGVDGLLDVDADGTPNYADLDDDGDLIDDAVEIGANPATPRDTDSDNIPDFQDSDSDNDSISDFVEGEFDTDGDDLGNWIDTDSDNDCLPDLQEAGGSPPLDSDEDGQRDYLDVDSDNDGLGDATEDPNCNGIVDAGETNPVDEDSDNDGVSDLVEDVADTDPNDPADNPQAHGDFFFLVPYEEPTQPPEDTLRFRTSVQFADLYFSFDITGSMNEEQTAMADPTSGVPGIIAALTCQPVGGTCNIDEDCGTGAICFNGQCVEDPIVGEGCVPDLWTGVGHWEDRDSFRNSLSLQSNPVTTANNVDVPLAGGSEAIFQAAQCVADGIGCTSPDKNCAASGLGCPGFRHNAVRILFQISDADNQCSGTPCSMWTAATAGAALQARGIKFVGLWGTGDDAGSNPATPETEMDAIGMASGTVDGAGNPFVYSAIDDAVVAQSRQAVLDIVTGLPLNVTIGTSELPGDSGDALPFIDHLVVNTSGGSCTEISPTVDGNGDGFDDSFPSLTPGTRVCWDVVPIAENNIVPATMDPQLFVARVTVYGDGSTLDTRDVFFLIPPVLGGID
jgi:hypothetical protein